MIDTNKTKRTAHVARSMRNSLPPRFCAAPFTQLFLTPTGDAFVCCEGAGHLGNLKDKTVEEMWNGEAAKKLRREFLSGKPLECQKKMECRRCNEVYDELLPEAEIAEVQTKLPIALDMMLNGKCNIDCIMCEVKTQTTSLPATPGYKSEIEEKLYPIVKRISLKSGEPLVQKETFEAIAKVQAVNPDCEWQFTTNGQYKFAGRIEELLSQIKIQRINFSIDSIDPQIFSEIRVRGVLQKALDSLGLMQDWAKRKNQNFPIEFSVNATLQKKNWRVLPELMKYFFDRGINTAVLFVEKPEQFSLSELPEAELLEVFKFYLSLPNEFSKFQPALFKALGSVLSSRTSSAFRKINLLVQMRLNELSRQKQEICSLPFAQLALDPNGRYIPCCWLHDYDLRDEKNQNALQTWNGNAAKKLREEQLTGKNIICGDKMKRVGCHQTHEYLIPLVSNSPTPIVQPLRFDWFFNGRCNLKCKSCMNWTFENEFEGSDECYEDLKKNVLPFICEIDVKGGEPFIQKRTFNLIEFMKKENQLCVWNITTNGQVHYNEYLKNALDNLVIGDFSVSIDSLIPAVFNKIRTGGDLAKTLDFLDHLTANRNGQSLGRKFRIVINFVFQKDNWQETEQIILFCLEKKLDLYLIPLVNPVSLSVYNLPSVEYVKVNEHIQKLASKYPLKTVLELSQALNRSMGPDMLRQMPVPQAMMGQSSI